MWQIQKRSRTNKTLKGRKIQEFHNNNNDNNNNNKMKENNI